MKFLKKVRKIQAAPWHAGDMLIGLSYDELIMTVHANEKKVDADAIKKVYKEILKQKLADADADLEQHMSQILAAV